MGGVLGAGGGREAGGSGVVLILEEIEMPSVAFLLVVAPCQAS